MCSNRRMIERMSESSLTIIQVVRGDDNSATRRPASPTRSGPGEACLACGGTDDVTRHVGWVDGVSVRVHTYHLEQFRLGETLQPGRHRR